MLYKFAQKKSDNSFAKYWSHVVSQAKNEISGLNGASQDEKMAKKITTDMIKLTSGIIQTPLKNIDDVNMSSKGSWQKMANLKEWQAEKPPSITQAKILYALSYCLIAVEKPLQKEKEIAKSNRGIPTALENNLLSLGIMAAGLRKLIEKLSELQATMQTNIST